MRIVSRSQMWSHWVLKRLGPNVSIAFINWTHLASSPAVTWHEKYSPVHLVCVTLHLHLSIYFVQRNSNNTAKCQKNRTTRLWHALTVAHCNQDSNNAKHTKRQINKKNGHQYLRKSVKSTCFTVLLNFEKELKSTVWGRDTKTFTSSLDVNLHKVFQFTRWIDVKYSPGVTWREIFTSSPGELMLNIHKFTRCDLWNIHQFTSWIDVKY